jgi:hypothetical protein
MFILFWGTLFQLRHQKHTTYQEVVRNWGKRTLDPLEFIHNL